MPISITRALRTIAIKPVMEEVVWALEREFRPLINELRHAALTLETEKRAGWTWVTVSGSTYQASAWEAVRMTIDGSATVKLPVLAAEEAGTAVLVFKASSFPASILVHANGVTINGGGTSFISSSRHRVFEWNGVNWSADT
jgi:hypothetical protein